MDTLTHALSGALLARATAPRQAQPGALSLRARMWMGFAAAAFPDSDFVFRWVDDLTYLNLHRGVTHSLICLPLWAFGLAALFALLSRGRYRWRAFVGVAMLGISIHIAGDVITAWGTKILAPFSDARASVPTTFIIDFFFTGIIVLGLLTASLLRRYGRVVARVGLAVLVAYVGMQGVMHQRALQIGEAFALRTGLRGSEVRAMPQPFSPFNWKVLVIDGDTYHEAAVNLIRRQPLRLTADAGWVNRIRASYAPADQAGWQRHYRFGSGSEAVLLAQEAWRHEAFAPFRRFAMFPVLYEFQRGARNTCAWFADLRFTMTERTPPFRFGMCRAAGGGTWRLERMR